ncbi:Coiled-coil-helix-coiled-coil-helix domain-containing protein 7 [Mizuhopecten yessoensis]|uniref:Coiled-coil-helix-coiled-coil-helix domain-containing protein 7 n=2 Tax=Mizuhopecten yessoensis TaxID=6573 RepID=A0A210QCD1_MIZYE|nr:Coiled-coil-helix-coiled-coil-helix domain-containing protein 7 [Mizuhopecten yessoensis]
MVSDVRDVAVMAASIESSSSSQKENKSKEKRGNAPLNPDYTLKSACLEEGKISLDCIRRHNFKDNSQCESEFQNYRNCKAFWTKVQWRRFWKGDRPTLPLPEDREQARKDYADIMEKVMAKSQK